MYAGPSPQRAIIRTTTKSTGNHRIIDRALRAARAGLLPRGEQERIHDLCVAAVGFEQNIGVIHRTAEDLAKREVAAWLQQHREAEAAIQRKVQDADRFFEDLRARFADPSGKLIPHGLRPEDKCAHGMYVPEFYCSFCREGRENEPGYDIEAYGEAARKGLAHAEYVLNQTSEGRGELEDLRQICAIEIWKASKAYGRKMDAKKARQVARNVGQGFLKDVIEETKDFLTDADGNPVLNEEGRAQGLDGGDLKRKSKDKSLSKAERKSAKRLLQQFQIRAPRFEPFVDEGTKTADGDVQPSTDSRLAGRERLRAAEDRAILNLDLQKLAGLVQTWHGLKRVVGEAVLAGDFTVRKVADASGMAPASVGRVYSAVIREFARIMKKHKKTETEVVFVDTSVSREEEHGANCPLPEADHDH